MSQRARSYHNPLHLGIFDKTSIRFLQGRLGAENKGQTGFRSTNDGTANAFMDVWFEIQLKKESYLIVLKEDQRQKKDYRISVYPKNAEKNQLAYPMKINGTDSYFNSMVAGYTSDIYNMIDDQSELRDKNRTSLFPLKPGNYVINISTQRWDAFKYGVYIIIEAPYQSGYIQLEDDEGQIESYLEQEQSTFSVPSFFLYEDAIVNVLPSVRENESHSERLFRTAWSQLNNKKPFPKEIQNYLKFANQTF